MTEALVINAEPVTLSTVDLEVIHWMRLIGGYKSVFFDMPEVFTFVEMMDHLSNEHHMRVHEVRPTMERLERLGFVRHFIADTGTDRYALTDRARGVVV
jgi:hypothetical protein